MLHHPFIKFLVFGRAGPLKSSRRIRRQKSFSIVMTLHTYPINMLKAGPDTCVCVTDGSSEWPSHCSPPLIVHPPLHPSSFPSPHLSSHPSSYPCYLHLFLLFNSFSFPFHHICLNIIHTVFIFSWKFFDLSSLLAFADNSGWWKLLLLSAIPSFFSV